MLTTNIRPGVVGTFLGVLSLTCTILMGVAAGWPATANAQIQVIVTATRNSWTPTAVPLLAGDTLTIAASGCAAFANHNYPENFFNPDGVRCYTSGPEPPYNSNALCSSSRLCRLVGKIGTAGCFTVGSDFEMVVFTPGTLSLAANDVVSGYGDNYGSFTAQISVRHAGPPFEILAATCDSSSYENGHGVVNLGVTIKNNWGPESTGLAVRVFSPQVFSTDVVSTTAFLPRGQTTFVPLNFLAPSPGMNIEYDLEIILNDSSYTSHDVFVGRQLSDQELAQMEQETLECLPPGQSCSLAVMGMVPYAGGVANAVSVVAGACDIAAATETGDVLRAAVGSADVALATFSAVTDYIAPPAGNVARFIASVIQAGIDCSFEAIRGTIGGTKSGGAAADSLATALQRSLDGMGATYSNQVVIDGPARLRIHNGGCFTDGDTLGVKRVVVADVDSTQYSWAFIGTGPVPLGMDSATNPNSAVLAEVLADSSGWLDVAIAHRTASGAVRQVRYQPFVVTATTRCQLSLKDGTEDFSLRVDFNGDGQADSLVYPEGTSDVPDWHNPSVGRSGIGRTEVRPNPFTGSTMLSFGVVGVIHGARVEIWDASGRRVRTIGLGDVASGIREVAWDGAGDDGKRLAGGIYFCQISYQGGRTEPRKSILLR